MDDVVAADGDGEEGLGQVSRGLRLPQALHQRRVHRREVVDLLVEADALVLHACMQHRYYLHASTEIQFGVFIREYCHIYCTSFLSNANGSWRLAHLVCGVGDSCATGSKVDAVGVVGVAARRQGQVRRRGRQSQVFSCKDVKYDMFY